MNIILAGPKGVGKTTAGKALSKALDRSFIDIDTQVESIHLQRSGFFMSCREIYKNLGFSYFRKIEEDAICELNPQRSDVIALGGRSLSSFKSRSQVRKLGLLIGLHLDRSKLKSRWDKNIPFYDEFDAIFDETMRDLRQVSTIWVNAESKQLLDILLRIVNGK